MRGVSDVQLMPASRVSAAQRVAVMNAAYADYYVPTHVTQDQLELMDRCYDIMPSRSVVGAHALGHPRHGPAFVASRSGLDQWGGSGARLAASRHRPFDGDLAD